MFVGAICDNFDQQVKQKIFHAEIVVDSEKVKKEEQHYKPIPIINSFTDSNGIDRMEEIIETNYYRIKEEINHIIKSELIRLKK